MFVCGRKGGGGGGGGGVSNQTSLHKVTGDMHL